MNLNIYDAHAFEGIYDMIAIILFAVFCGLSLLVAILIEITNKGRSDLQKLWQVCTYMM